MDSLNTPVTLFRHLSQEGALAVIRSGKLRWSHPRRFNDEFDIPESILDHVDSDDVFSEISQRLRELAQDASPDLRRFQPDVRLIVTLLKMLEPGQREEMLRRSADGFRSQPRGEHLEAFRDHWRKVHPTTRVLCLTKRSDSPSMWDRYSDNHRGAVLEFAPSACNCKHVFGIAMPITYVQCPTYNCNTAAGFADILMTGAIQGTLRIYEEYIFTKTAAWSDENEWRLIRWGMDDAASDITDIAFSPSKLTSIRFGNRADESFITEIKRCLGSYPGVTLYKMVSDTAQRRLRSVAIT